MSAPAKMSPASRMAVATVAAAPVGEFVEPVRRAIHSRIRKNAPANAKDKAPPRDPVMNNVKPAGNFTFVKCPAKKSLMSGIVFG